MDKPVKTGFNVLAHSWWKIYRSTDESLGPEVRNYITTRAFEELLKQCGWTISEWNKEIEAEEKKKKSLS